MFYRLIPTKCHRWLGAAPIFSRFQPYFQRAFSRINLEKALNRFKILYERLRNLLLGDVATCLKVDMENVLKWFHSNRMVTNPDKFQVIFIGLPKSRKYIY